MISKGSAALVAICKGLDRGQTAVAEALGENQSLVSRWAAGDRTPSAQNRKKLQESYGIDLWSWDEPDESSSDAPPDAERAAS